MADRSNEYLVSKRDMSSPYYKQYCESREARRPVQTPANYRAPIMNSYFDTEPEDAVNENQGKKVRKEKVKRQRTKGTVKRARRGFMVFLVMLFALLYVAVGALSFLQIEALDEYNSYFNMFTKVEEIIPEGATLEDIENGDVEYEYVTTNVGLDDIVMSFAKMFMGDSIEGDYYFYNECLALIDGAETMNMIAYYVLPVALILGLVVALRSELLGLEEILELAGFVNLAEGTLLDEVTLDFIVGKLFVALEDDLADLHLLLLVDGDVEDDLVFAGDIVALDNVDFSIVITLVVEVFFCQDLGAVYHVGCDLCTTHNTQFGFHVLSL